MTDVVRYLTHPQVLVDPEKPVPSWGLNAIGQARVQSFVANGWLAGTTQVISSNERKAVETAEPIATALGVSLEVCSAMHENDRSATGYVPPDEFEQIANAFFATPNMSVRGWERAIDAQERIVHEAEQVLKRDLAGDVLFVGHGAVGTLLYCHYANAKIDRRHDQPAGGGHYFTMTKRKRKPLHAWKPMEECFLVEP